MPTHLAFETNGNLLVSDGSVRDAFHFSVVSVSSNLWVDMRSIFVQPSNRIRRIDFTTGESREMISDGSMRAARVGADASIFLSCRIVRCRSRVDHHRHWGWSYIGWINSECGAN